MMDHHRALICINRALSSVLPPAMATILACSGTVLATHHEKTCLSLSIKRCDASGRFGVFVVHKLDAS